MERKARVVPEQKRLLDAVNKCASCAPGVLRHREPGSPLLGASLHLGVPKAPWCPVPPITQTLPKSSLSSFLPPADFPWQCSSGKAAALTPV